MHDRSRSARGLIIAPHEDVHAHAVRHAAESLGYQVEVVDSAEFTSKFGLSLNLSQAHVHARLEFASGKTLDLSSISGLWWRRPKTPAVANDAFRAIKQDEAREALFGTLDAIVPHAFNPPAFSHAAGRKITQLQRARSIGLKVPTTLVTNDERAARDFFHARSSDLIYKVFKGPAAGFFPTRVLTSADLAELGGLRECPCIFQELVQGVCDVRVTVVGEQVFSAEMGRGRTDEVVDTRMLSAEATPHSLPPILTKSLVELARSFGLAYCAIDLRLTQSGEYVFFELNPEGQYLWTEIEAGLPISAAIASLLLNLEPSENPSRSS